VDANQRRDIAAHLSSKEDNKLFLGGEGAVRGNLKLSPFSGQMSNCNPLDRSRPN
jgi:hypothetical protein